MGAYRVEDVSQDMLMGGAEVPALTKNITIASGQKALKRGTLLSETDDKCAIVASGEEAKYVLATDAVEATTDTVSVAYVSGRFNVEAMTVAEGDTVIKHEDELRKVGIFLTHIK